MLVWIIWFEMKMVQIKKCYQMSQISLNALIQQQERKQVLSLPIYRVLYKHNTVTVSKIYIWAWKVNRQLYHSRWLTVQFASHAIFSDPNLWFIQVYRGPKLMTKRFRKWKKTLKLNVIFNKFFESAWFNENVIV